MKRHRSYKEIKQGFSEKRRAKIEKGTEKLRNELKILTEVRKAAGFTQEELADILDVRQSYISQVESRDNITIQTLIAVITAMGGSIDITVNFPQKKPLQFLQIENLLAINKESSETSKTKVQKL